MTRVVALEDLDFSEAVLPGDTVMWSQASAEPVALIERLLAQRHAIGPFRVFTGGSYSGALRPEHADVVTIMGMGAVGTNRALCDAGAMEIVPCHVSELPGLIAAGIIRVDVVLVQVSARESFASGSVSVGAFSGYLQAALQQARVVIAEANDQAPWTYAREPLDPSAINLVVPVSRPLVEVGTLSAPAPEDATIAEQVVGLIDDGAILQLGIGTVPDAVARGLGGRQHLGVHSGIVGDAVAGLMEAGVVTNDRKPFDRGVTVTGGLLGSERLYRFAHGNPALRVEPVSYTHNPAVLRALDGLVAINSALEVDLTGQAGAEVAGRRYVGTIGGHGDFVRAALAAEGGRSIIALASRTRKAAPRIVPHLRSGVVTMPRADADAVVTEHGVAELRGRSIAERVRRMVAIAHPDDREDLERSAAGIAGLP